MLGTLKALAANRRTTQVQDNNKTPEQLALYRAIQSITGEQTATGSPLMAQAVSYFHLIPSGDIPAFADLTRTLINNYDRELDAINRERSQAALPTE